MAEGPINYGSLLTQLDFSPLQRGLQLRRDNRVQEAEAARQRSVQQLAQRQFEMKAADQQGYLEAVQAYRTNPTPEALRDLGIRFPEHQKELQDAGDSYTASQKNDLIGAGFSALGALSNSKPDLAVKTLQDRVTALKNSGIDTSHTQAAIDMIKNGDVQGATSYLGYAMSGLVGADHAANVMTTLGIGKKAENDERRLDQTDRRIDNSERATNAAIARGDAASARAERAADRADRKAAGGGKSSGGGGNYEYRVVNGALQRRRKP